MPQEQEVTQQAIDPKTNPVGFIYQNRKALTNMPEEKALRLIDVTFRRHMLPKYQQINKQGLSPQEVEGLRLSFFARMLDIGSPEQRQVSVKGTEKEPGFVKKSLAGVVGAGAGVLGGIRSFSDLVAKLDKTDLSKDPIHKAISSAEGKAYEEAQALDPTSASRGAAVGHQIPAAIMAEGAGGLVGKLAPGAPAALRVGAGGARGAAEGATFESARPGGDPKSGAMWGGMLGAAFPALGKLFNLGRGTAAPTREAVSTVGSSAGTATSTVPGSSQELPDMVAKKVFGKSFKDLNPAERSAMPGHLKTEIGALRTAKQEGKKASREAMKAASEADKAAQRGEKAKAASEKAGKQAESRKVGEPLNVPAKSGSEQVLVPKATAQAAVAQNPQASKVAATFTPEVKPEPTVTKVPEGQRGVQKAGSPAKQAADRERIAKKREEATREQINTSLEQHARELAGKHSPASLNLMHLPEMEEAIQELPGGKEVLNGARLARKNYKLSDDLYMETLKEWMLDQFSQQP